VKTSAALDSVGLHVLHNALANVAAEMALVMMKTSYSTIFNEGLDFSTVLLDRYGQLIAEKNYTPSMMGAVSHTVAWTLEELGEEFFQPGDVVVHNDPYRGNCHIPEHMLMKPIFVDGQLTAFAGCIGHLAEVGGKAPGSFASDATDVYQEGLRLPPVKLMEGGRYNQQLWRVIMANHRTPRHTWGDFHAMIGALAVGERRLEHLIQRYSVETVRVGAQRLIEHSEQRLRAEIAELPDGAYSAEMEVEDDGVTSNPFHVQVKVVVHGDEVIADFTGSDPQVRGPMNCTFVVAASAVYNAVFCVTDPLSLIPRNSGCYRPMRIIAPAGSVVNVRHPGPSVGGNTDLQPKLIDLLLAALAQAVPERVSASSGGSSSNLLFGGVHPDTGRYFSNYHFDGMGAGATCLSDGNDAETTRHSNCRNTPVEVFEHRYPILNLNYELVTDSGGPGEHRGGLATTRTLRVLADEITFSALFDRCRIPPWGLFEGRPGMASSLEVRRAGEAGYQSFTQAFGVASPTKFTNVVLRRGDELRYRTPGGGGFGHPGRRDRATLAEDVADAFVSPLAAVSDYAPSARASAPAKPDRPKARPVTFAPVPPTQGDWVELGLAWSDTAVTNCQVCGRLIPRREWRFEGGSGPLRACSPACEDLYAAYVRPTHGVRSPDAHN
jgi:N-methylhydantoinase B/oxoprolinase/acetone carboxylase alpha subunit